MSGAQTLFPAADLQPGPADLVLTPEQFLSIPRFGTLSNQGQIRKCQGALVLRHYKAGQPICLQGAAGSSAYHILGWADLYGLFAYVEKRIDVFSKTQAALSATVSPNSADAQANQRKRDNVQKHLDQASTELAELQRKVPLPTDARTLAKVRDGHLADVQIAEVWKATDRAATQADTQAKAAEKAVFGAVGCWDVRYAE